METTRELEREREAVERERREANDLDAPCTAEMVDCHCPDFCERDHANE